MPSVAHLVPNYLSVKEQAHFRAPAACAARRHPCGLPVLFSTRAALIFWQLPNAGWMNHNLNLQRMLSSCWRTWIGTKHQNWISLEVLCSLMSTFRWSLLLPPDVQHLLRSKVIGSYRWYKNVEGQDKWWFIRLHYSWKLVHEYIAMLLNWIQKFPKSLLILVVLYFCNSIKYVFN